MATCPKCNRRIPDDSTECAHCRATIPPASQRSKPSGGTGYTYLIVLGIWYLIVWPLLSFDLIYSLLKALTGCLPGNCRQLRTPLDDLPSAGLVFISVTVLVLFLLSIRAKPAGNKFARFIAETHRYACLLTPSALDIGGLSLPAPFLVSMPYALAHERELPILLALFGLTWILVFIAIAADAVIPPIRARLSRHSRND